MSDFASSAMLRVLHLGMLRQGLQSPGQAWPSTVYKAAQVPLDAKLRLVEHVIEQRGWLGALQLGQGVLDVQGEPLMHYLLASNEPLQVLQAWLRLERYIHSRHRTQLISISGNAVQMQHISLVPERPPSAAEDVVVLGVLLGLLQRAGVSGLAFRWSDGMSWLQDFDAAAASLQSALERKQSQSWQLMWSDDREPSHECERVRVSGGWQQQLTQFLSEQLQAYQVERLQIDACATALRLSPRSLQRYLQAEGTRFVDVLGQVRCKAAARLLGGSQSLAEIGFASGYTDQAHFCREFKRRVGMTALQFRQQAQSA